MKVCSKVHRQRRSGLPRVPTSTGGPVWLWSLIVVAAAGLAYAAGYQSLARRLRKKFGGLRIY
jgi:amino acid transporter